MRIRLASIVLTLLMGAFRTHSSRIPYHVVDIRPNFFMRIAGLAVSHLERAQSVGICGGVIVQAINHNVRMRGTSLDGAGINSNLVRYLWKV
jgi:hypothetical protein